MTAVCCGQSSDYSGIAYSGAFVKGNTITVFPANSRSFAKHLTTPLGRFVYGPRGTALFGETDSATNRSIVRLDLSSGSIARLPETEPFRSLSSLVVSADETKLLLSGERVSGQAVECGIFLYTVATAIVRQVVKSEDRGCNYVQSWRDLSLSPDARLAVAVRAGKIELIDIDLGTVKRVANGIGTAWSPNGKWIAIAEDGPTIHIRPLGANDLNPGEIIGTADVSSIAWSPDSRHILTWQARVLCGSGYFGTLFAIDVLSKSAAAIRSSECAVNLNTLGWVANAVFPN